MSVIWWKPLSATTSMSTFGWMRRKPPKISKASPNPSVSPSHWPPLYRGVQGGCGRCRGPGKVPRPRRSVSRCHRIRLAKGTAANIQLHHKWGFLRIFELVEPLRDLFKDEVRKLGEVLGVPDQIVWRHPFPGPGLAVRIIGDITKDRLDLLRECDEILLEEIVSANLYRTTSQVFAVLLPIQSVGVMGDGRSYESVVALRSVETQDFMTADWSRLPYEVLAEVSSRISNEVKGVNRVVYDISSKPPATIEWE